MQIFYLYWPYYFRFSLPCNSKVSYKIFVIFFAVREYHMKYYKLFIAQHFQRQHSFQRTADNGKVLPPCSTTLLLHYYFLFLAEPTLISLFIRYFVTQGGNAETMKNHVLYYLPRFDRINVGVKHCSFLGDKIISPTILLPSSLSFFILHLVQCSNREQSLEHDIASPLTELKVVPKQPDTFSLPQKCIYKFSKILMFWE